MTRPSPVIATPHPKGQRPPISRMVRDITGVRNGRLVAVELVGRNHEGRALWRCLCDCGTEKTVQGNNLVREGGTKSCGCLRRDANAAKIQANGSWNDGKSYAIEDGKRCYKTVATPTTGRPRLPAGCTPLPMVWCFARTAIA